MSKRVGAWLTIFLIYCDLVLSLDVLLSCGEQVERRMFPLVIADLMLMVANCDSHWTEMRVSNGYVKGTCPESC